MIPQNETLVLIYNADSGIFNALSDTLAKTFAKDDYECSLCAVTHGMVSMRHEWRKFLGSLPVAKKIYHRDDFVRDYPNLRPSLPVIMLAQGGAQPEILIGSDELNEISDLSELIGLTQHRLAQLRKSNAG